VTMFIDDRDFSGFFEDFAHTAWRLESRGGYDSDRQTDTYQRFLRGEDLRQNANRPWCRNIRVQIAQGKRIERVRILDQPPTTGQRYLLASAWSNVEAGEDIRHLWRAEAEQLALPREDFWLFDSRYALRLHFNGDDRYLGAELIDDPAVIVRYCQVRDAAWHHAVRHDEFKARVPSPV
jgi:hypothetical protein